MVWVDEACGFFEKERAGTLKPNDVYLFRVTQMLGDYAVHGAVLGRYSRSVDVDREGADTVIRFQVWLLAADLARSTVRVYGTVAGEFVAFVGTRGGLARCDADAIEAFVASRWGTGRTQTRRYVFDIRRTSSTSSLTTRDLVSQHAQDSRRQAQVHRHEDGP